MNLALKQKKFALAKMLATEIAPSNVQNLKFPIGPDAMTKFEPNPIKAVKNLVAQKKGIKLFRKKK